MKENESIDTKKNKIFIKTGNEIEHEIYSASEDMQPEYVDRLLKSKWILLSDHEKEINELLEQNTMLARNHLLLEQDFIECLDLLFEMVYQACAVHPYGVQDCLDSMALRTNVEAMKYLADHGRLKITKEEGRRVFATVVV